MDGREDRSKTERLRNSRRIRQNGTKTENTPILVVICENRFQERAKRKNFIKMSEFIHLFAKQKPTERVRGWKREEVQSIIEMPGSF